MRSLAILLSLPLLAQTQAPGRPDKATAAELKRLAGTWRALKVTVRQKTVEAGGALRWALRPAILPPEYRRRRGEARVSCEPPLPLYRPCFTTTPLRALRSRSRTV
jgi:hypothetical protein